MDGCMVSPSMSESSSPPIASSSASSHSSPSALRMMMATRYDGLPFLRRYPRSRWRKIRMLFFVACRFRGLSRQAQADRDMAEDEDNSQVQFTQAWTLSSKLGQIADFVLPPSHGQHNLSA